MAGALSPDPVYGRAHGCISAPDPSSAASQNCSAACELEEGGNTTASVRVTRYSSRYWFVNALMAPRKAARGYA